MVEKAIDNYVRNPGVDVVPPMTARLSCRKIYRNCFDIIKERSTGDHEQRKNTTVCFSRQRVFDNTPVDNIMSKRMGIIEALKILLPTSRYG